MAKNIGRTRNTSRGNNNSNWVKNWNPSPITGWSKSPYGDVISPLKDRLIPANPLRTGLIDNNPEYNNISIGRYGENISIKGASSAKVAENFINDLMAAEKAQREITLYLNRVNEITPKVRLDVDGIVKKWERKIGKKLQ